MLNLILLAIGLAMDACVVAISLGSKHKSHTLKMALFTCFYFGIFQGIMPLIGYWSGHSILSFVADYTDWISCFILVILGGKMLYEAFSIDKGVDKNSDGSDLIALAITPKVMIPLSIATSLDAIAAGFTLNLLAINAYIACIIIAIVTGIISFVGVYIGKLSGTWSESKAEIFGGLILIGMGIKMLF